MKLQLNDLFAANVAANDDDTRAVKLALNRLGFYIPDDRVGITDTPDARIFAAIKAFQTQSGLPADGEISRFGETVAALNVALAAVGDHGSYIWHTVGDDYVRPEHVVRNGQKFSWRDHPHPAEEPGCRCWAVNVRKSIEDIYDPPIEPVYPELLLFPALSLRKWAQNFLVGMTKSLTSISSERKNTNYTTHGSTRTNERSISPEEIDRAIETAKKTGDFSTKIGKYQTPQIHYKGTNGVTVIIETVGRNAGKVITSWRHK
jgi:peptidoglycan hydrolase-like protein with peptidoglycan-binding domain